MMKRPTLSYDFAIGVLMALGVVAAHKIWELKRSASLKRVQDVANRPLAHVGDDDKITVYGDEEATEEAYRTGISDFSPFVNRVEGFLRLIKQPYVKAATFDMAENPRHKIPFANVKGTMLDDSGRIIEAIQKKFNIVENLSEEQKVTGHLIRGLLFDSLYFVLAFVVFDTEKGRAYITELLKEKPIPAILRPFILDLLFQHEHANLYGQGYGRYPEQDIIQKGRDDIRALGGVLGTNKFILGTDEPTSYDTDTYAFLCLVFKQDADGPLAEFGAEPKKANPNLVAYVDRMKKILYP